MKPGKKSPKKKGTGHQKQENLEETKKRIEQQQRALKKIIRSFTKKNSEEE